MIGFEEAEVKPRQNVTLQNQRANGEWENTIDLENRYADRG